MVKNIHNAKASRPFFSNDFNQTDYSRPLESNLLRKKESVFYRFLAISNPITAKWFITIRPTLPSFCITLYRVVSSSWSNEVWIVLLVWLCKITDDGWEHSGVEPVKYIYIVFSISLPAKHILTLLLKSTALCQIQHFCADSRMICVYITYSWTMPEKASDRQYPEQTKPWLNQLCLTDTTFLFQTKIWRGSFT